MSPVRADGFVLAGGQSRRMGVDKAMLSFRGRPLTLNAVEILRPLRIPVRVLVAPGQQLPVCEEMQMLDLVEGAGPLGGLYTALVSSASNLVVILACDLPLVTSALFESLARERKQADLIAPMDYKGQVQPLCGIYSVRCLEVVKQKLEKGRLGLQDLFSCSQLKSRLLDASSAGFPEHVLLNVNAPEDWSALQKARPHEL